MNEGGMDEGGMDEGGMNEGGVDNRVKRGGHVDGGKIIFV
jgi:hypothetical protein